MTELSPSAQAVLDAFLGDAEDTGLQIDDMRENVAAALRAAVDEVAPEKTKELLETLDQATVTCADCGDKYGVHSVRYSSWWNGKCHVCNEEKPVTEAGSWCGSRR